MISRASDIPTQQTPPRDLPAPTERSATAERRRRPWHLYLLSAVGVVLAVLALADIGPATSSARTSTQIVTAEQGVVQSTVTGSGNVAAGTEMNVNFQTSGTLSNVYVHVGEHVEKGQLLATLDQTSATLTLEQAEQNLLAAEDQLSSAESGSSTSTGSTTGSSGSSSSSSTTSSAASVASAQAAVDGAQASVGNAQTALGNTKLYAPTSGTIVSLASLSPGDTVSAGSTGNASTSSSNATTSSSGSSSGTAAGSLGGSSTSTSTSSSSGSTSSAFAGIANTSKMTMTVPFSESDVGKLKVGQAATVTPDALSGVELGAHVTAISPTATTSSGVVSYDATLTLDQSDSSVKAGMSASAAVIVGQVQGVTVPNAAVSGTGSLATVTVQSNGKRSQQQVVVGLRGNSRTQIVSGLTAGEQVVIVTTLPALSSTTTSTTTGSGTLGATGARTGGFGGGGGFAGAGGAGGAGSGRGAGAGAAG
jgi:macrolide-specific efflux system membrane fusion protein